eukprot:2996649-Heterocapsa_arctica.AAC.1
MKLSSALCLLQYVGSSALGAVRSFLGIVRALNTAGVDEICHASTMEAPPCELIPLLCLLSLLLSIIA